MHHKAFQQNLNVKCKNESARTEAASHNRSVPNTRPVIYSVNTVDISSIPSLNVSLQLCSDLFFSLSFYSLTGLERQT